ncbi:hypothetical protein TVAG_337740 [Trichomonas vaginalis G3]|uniref:Uncharacterized protein n=1 Tax=Trichomonas vaginalis (strain ATCC PRA-98 / G3) TaxID=412133 RepID=A2EWM0_TRIV3|nr:hypothetical protein TVAGG3_1021730 [Trichomonas vaginalis G3]EAY02974.1 hypothetical protein TVAG_337740 [Trichomonas vaginalis G3]KAI5492185.1 hypothetical protein TVAGG3_1021730 [Trichomonas vaginalis G3]|eukprot:XP_001315197.1 hypothetical protein [Trichomonas vaginalis G3]
MENPEESPVKSVAEPILTDPDIDIPIYKTTEIPKRFVFKNMENFLIKIDQTAYDDTSWICKKFINNYDLTIDFCEKLISQINERINKAKKTLSECFQRSLVPNKLKYVAVNSNSFFYLIVLLKRKTSLEKILNENIISTFTYRKSIISKIIALAKHLKKYPRSYVINIGRLHALNPQHTDFMIETVLKIKALEVAISDVKVMHIYTPKIALQPSERTEFMKTSILSCLRYQDPLTGYIPETEHHGTFATFMDSRFEIHKMAKTSSIETIIKRTIEGSTEFTNFKSPELIQALKTLASRYWFDKLIIVNKFYKENYNPKFSSYVKSLRSCSLKELGITNKLFKKLGHFKFSSELLNSYISFRDVSYDYIESLLYQTSPLDIARNYYTIDLLISGFVANTLNQSIDTKDVKENLPFMWSVIFINCPCTVIDLPIKFVMKYHDLCDIPHFLIEKCKVPYDIIMKWQAKC